MRFLALLSFFLICVNSSIASQLNNTTTSFNIKEANRKFDHINLQLSVQNLDLNNLLAAVNTLSSLINSADECIDEEQKKLANINLLIKQGGGGAVGKDEGADLVYLSKQQKDAADQQAQCRLFSIRAKEAIEAYRSAIEQLKQQQALTRETPLWVIFNQLMDSPPKTSLLSDFKTKIIAILPPALICILFMGIALIAATATLMRIRKNRFTHRYLRFKKLHISHIILLTFFFISFARLVYLLAFMQDLNTADPALLMPGLAFIYFSALMLIIFIFKLKKTRTLFYWYSLDITFFQPFIITLLSFYMVNLIAHVFSSAFNANSLEWQLCQSLFLLIILATGAYFISHFCKTHRNLSFVKHHHSFIKRFSALLLLLCAIINILGYHTLAHYLTLSGFTTCVIIIITLLFTQGIKKFYFNLSHQDAAKTKIIKYFGYRADQVFTEFLILKSTAQLIIIAIAIYFIGQTWGFATDFIESLYDQILHGVHVVNVTIYPTRIICGIVVFCLLYLVFRSISTALSRQQQFENEEETQVAIASILNYVGFAIAVLAGLLVAGFNFTGLTIIAGALSVGIGLGLQSIVNNFVSGIILLIEKPIRPGDRISVDGVEGFVKKIRVRSTQIITPAREDIIVPNADLISRRVTNFMFSDKYCRINCDVGIAYGSDTNLVREILLNIANKHEEIIKSGHNKPAVLFISFTEKALIFQLSCLIKDVNKKAIVQSELNFDIDRAFREHNIWKLS